MAALARDFLPLLRFLGDGIDVGVVVTQINFLEAVVRVQLRHVPRMQFFDVRDGVQETTFLQDVGVLREQRLGDDAPPMVLRLEVRVGKTEENLLQGCFWQ